ncbi:DegV family protein [Alkalibacter mobilis]|uniref:DegV family protein n=1 Tax=Alkalibacter mobilis TaxID=2787712 RepID=UPI00189E9E83|nr:DegV family protein [Alkalibacter mobilis]MBF7096545.1 DegV family protein [Alkalibacter mobilis]
MGVRIITDSASDISKQLEEDFNIKVVPLTVNFGEDEHFKDRYEIASDAFFEKLKTTEKTPSTSQVNPGEFETVFKEILDDGDELVGIFLSSELSGTYNSAVMAKEMFSENQDKIYLIDSRSVSLGLSLLVYEAAKMANKGATAEEIKEYIEKAKEKVETIIVVDTLEYLKKGGRLSAGAAFIGSVLNLKPILILEDGKLVAVDKVRGRKKAISWIKEWLLKNNFDLDDKSVFMVHAAEPGYMNELKEFIVKSYNTKDIFTSQVGGVVGTHSGPGAIGFSFLNL